MCMERHVLPKIYLYHFQTPGLIKFFVSTAPGDSSNFDLLLKEFWRVLKPEGQIIIISSSRSGELDKKYGSFQ